jgi:polyribonucleotide nucleotidyltransferase
MFDIQREELMWGGRKLTLETGKMARQADGAVVATYGETTVWRPSSPKSSRSRLRLLPAHRELPGAHLRGRPHPGRLFQARGAPDREGDTRLPPHRPADPPAFRAGLQNDTQVVVTVLSHDLENDPDIVEWWRASAALTSRACPSWARSAPARVGYIGGAYRLNPPLQELEATTLDLVVAGTQDAVLMVESEAKELAEDVMLGAVMFGHKHFQPVIDAIIRLAEKAAKEPRDYQAADVAEIETAVLGIAEQELREAYKITRKQDRYAAVDAVKAKVMEELAPAEGEARFAPEK